jgi:hypothetical protein
MPIHAVALMVSFSFLYLLHPPINHQPFTMDNGLNTWACLLYVIHQQPLGFSARAKNTSEMLQLKDSAEMHRYSIYVPLHHQLELSQY